MAKPLYILKHDNRGTGGFLCPPGHPAHSYAVEGYWGGRHKPVNGPDLCAGIDFLIEDEYGDVPEDLKARAQKIMDTANLRCSEAWLREVYGYFHNSYSPDGVDRNVSNAISASKIHCSCGEEFWNHKGLNYHLRKYRTGFTAFGVVVGYTPGHGEITVPLPPATNHLGYLCVKKYFPDHAPRLDLIKNPATTGPAYGTHECPKCGERVQYEARQDAWAVVSSFPRWTYNIKCAAGGWHW